MQRREHAPPLALCGLAAFAGLAAAASLTALPPAARACLALPLTLYLPGAALCSAVFPGQARTAETRVLAVALSLALTVLCGLGLNAIGRLTPAGWALALAGATVLFVLAALARRPAGLPAGLELRVSGFEALGPWWNRIAFAVAAALALGAVLLARHGAEAQHEYRYTEFWMVAAPGDHPSLATLGLFNAEQATATYGVDILLDGKLVDRWPPITLQPGETRTASLDLPQKALGGRVEAQLYRDGDRDTVYRKVWVAVPPSRSAAERAAAKAPMFESGDAADVDRLGKTPILNAQVKPKGRLQTANHRLSGRQLSAQPLADRPVAGPQAASSGTERVAPCASSCCRSSTLPSSAVRSGT